MNASRVLIATACSLAVAGAAGLAFAQTTTPNSPNSTLQNQNPGSGQLQGQSTTTPSTTPGSMNTMTQSQRDAMTQSQRDASTSSGNTGLSSTTGNTGTLGTRNADGTLRSSDDRAMGTERAARADRN